MSIGFFIIDTKERRTLAASFVACLKGSPVMQVEVKEYKPTRSIAQNRLMWMWYGVLGPEIGMKPEELHELMKARVLGFEQIELPKELWGKGGFATKVTVAKSTTKLPTAEMTKFLEAIEALAVELGTILPHPDDYRYAMYGERIPT